MMAAVSRVAASSTVGGPNGQQWRGALTALALCTAWTLFWYWDTATAIVTIWYRSETFTHGFIVPPISFWLIWRQREHLSALVPRGSPWVVVLIAASAFGWLLGDLVAVNAVTQLALVATLVLAVPAVLGVHVARAITFPLAFLFFAVPIGEFVMPQMMDWTAQFTVIALRFTGIPVYQEGLQFVIPSGNWSVIEACSGVRYLIASFVVGTLFAYLNYRSARRRVAFAIVSILVPILANWFRAYMIVMLGHLSGNKLAVGVDHLIYGWVFFGVVITLMFVIGARWAEEPANWIAQQPQEYAVTRSRALVWGVAFATLVVVSLPPLAVRMIDADQVKSVPTLALPSGSSAFRGWSRIDSFTNWRPVYENPSVAISQAFERDGRRAAVYVAYYRNQGYANKLVTSTNVLVTSTDKHWARVRAGTRELKLPTGPLQIRDVEVRGTGSERLVVWQWYWINGRLTASDYLAKVYAAFSQLLGQGDDSAVVILYAPQPQAGGGEAGLEVFAATAWPAIEAALIQAQKSR